MSAARRPATAALAAYFNGVIARVENAGAFPPALVRLLHSVPQFSAYTLVSIVALGCDLASYMAAVGAGYAPYTAGIAGYGLGTIVNYVLSTRFVFDRDLTQKSDTRLFSEYALSGVAGLIVTATVIATATGLFGLPALTAKLMAVATSFLMVYALRRTVVFSDTRA